MKVILNILEIKEQGEVRYRIYSSHTMTKLLSRMRNEWSRMRNECSRERNECSRKSYKATEYNTVQHRTLYSTVLCLTHYKKKH